MKTVSPQLQTHFGLDCTTLAVLWRVTRTDGTIMGFTTHDQDLDYDGVLYSAATGFTNSAAESKSDMSVDNIEVTGFLDSDSIDENDIRAGVYDNAVVEQFVVNWADLTMGHMVVSKGNIGNVKMVNGVFQAEIRGLAQKFTTVLGSTYGPICRAELGSGIAQPTGKPLGVTVLPPLQDSNGYGAYGAFFDPDGVHAWLFQYFASGVYRVNLQTRTIDTPGATNADGSWVWPSGWSDSYPQTHEDGTPNVIFDSHGYMYVQTSSRYPKSDLHKVRTSDMSEQGLLTDTPNWETATTFDWNGKTYLVAFGMASTRYGYVVNLTDMQWVGAFPFTSSYCSPWPWQQGLASVRNGSAFVDENGEVWFMGGIQNNHTNGGCFLVRWNPANGTTAMPAGDVAAYGSSLLAGTQVTFVSNATLQQTMLHLNNPYFGDNGDYYTSPSFACYVPSSHAALIADFNDWTSDLCLLSLDTFTPLATLPDHSDLAKAAPSDTSGYRFYSGSFDAPISAFESGVQNGKLVIPVGTDYANFGGILQVIDPETLTVEQEVDVTALIAATAGLPAAPADCPLGNCRWNAATNQVLVTYEWVGSPVYVVQLPTGGTTTSSKPCTNWLCNVDLSNYRQNGTVESSDGAVIVPVPGLVATGSESPTDPAPARWFDDGIIQFLTGQNAGRCFEVKSWDGTQLELFIGAPFPITPGDTFTIEPGCNHTISDCQQKFSNIVNFRGEPFIPGTDVLFMYPDAHSD